MSALTTIESEVIKQVQAWVESELRITNKQIEVAKKSLEALKTAFKGLEDVWNKNRGLKIERQMEVDAIKHLLKWNKRGYEGSCTVFTATGHGSVTRTLDKVDEVLRQHGC